jgi:glutamate dehydrogenase
LNRKVETLPDDQELTERYLSGRPLSRPEIGVLLSYAKIVLFDSLIDSAIPDDPYFADVLKAYFPAKMQKPYADDIANHRLHREIVATALANEVINRGGPGFVQQMSDMTGATAANVVKAAFLGRDGFDLPKLWQEIDALDGKLSGDVQNDLYARVSAIFAEATRLIVQTQVGAGDLNGAMDRLKAALKGLRASISSLDVIDAAARAAELEERGVPASLARDIVLLSTLVLVPEIMLIADRTGETMARAAESYFAVTATFRVNRLIESAERISTSDHYESLAISRSLQQIASARRDIVISALMNHPKEKKPLEAWHGSDRVRVNRIGAELVALSEGSDLTLPKVTVAAGLLGDLAHGRTV